MALHTQQRSRLQVVLVIQLLLVAMGGCISHNTQASKALYQSGEVLIADDGTVYETNKAPLLAQYDRSFVWAVGGTAFAVLLLVLAVLALRGRPWALAALRIGLWLQGGVVLLFAVGIALLGALLYGGVARQGEIAEFIVGLLTVLGGLWLWLHIWLLRGLRRPKAN